MNNNICGNNCYITDVEPTWYTVSSSPNYGCKLSKEPHFFFGGAFNLEAQVACIERVLYNDPVTVVFWNDGTKTIAKCHEEDSYNPESGLSICILKKLVGGASLFKTFADWIPENDEKQVTMRDVRKKHK